MSIAPNTTFTFSKNQSDDAANIAFILRQLDENRVPVGTEINLIPTVVTHTFTTAENARYIQIACKRYGNVECKGTYKPMLELGDTATEYEKYTVYGVGDKTNIDDELYRYKIPLVNSGKNLIPYPYASTTKTVNGVTYTDNGDGSVTVSGTATDYSDFIFKIMSIAPNTTFTFSKNQSDDAANITFTLRQLDENKALIGTDIFLMPTVVTHTFTTIENARYITIACKRDENIECKGTYKPMLELGDTATEYEPYRAPYTTNVYHSAPLKDGDSISYKADGLPELQLYKGENNITADTEVAPSTIDIKYLN